MICIKKRQISTLHIADLNAIRIFVFSQVCRSMVLWVQAIDTYAKVFKIVEPKVLA